MLKDKIFPPGLEMADLRRELASALPHGVGNLLDVGCAEGNATRLYAETLSVPLSEVAGIDGQPRHKDSLPFRVHILDIERDPFPFPDETFDLVICNQVLEHLKVVIHPLREAVRVLRRGGVLALGIPNLASLLSRIYLVLGKEPVCLAYPGPHVRGFTHRSFIRFLRSNANLTLLKTSGTALYPFPPPLDGILARRLPGLACYTLYVLRKIKHDSSANWPSHPSELLTG